MMKGDAGRDLRARSHRLGGEDTFYDQHPFDYLAVGGGESYQPLQLQRSLFDSLKDRAVADVGCGPGNDIAYAARVGLRVVGFDLSLRSLQIMKARHKQAAVCADNLALPIRSNAFDCCMSSGVIHHTANPQRSLTELARVIKPGGYLYLAIYKPGGRYWFFYTFVGAALRLLIRRGGSLGRLLVHSTVLPVYWLAHKFKSRGRRTWAGATNLFYDYFITPIVHFLPKDTILQWAGSMDLSMTAYESSSKFNVQSFIFRRIK